jgi:hypothetical protein
MAVSRRDMLVIFTIGHSTRTLAAFIRLVKAHGIRRVIDVRTIPRSRHNTQFNRERLSPALHSARLHYRHMPGLGGLRRALLLEECGLAKRRLSRLCTLPRSYVRLISSDHSRTVLAAYAGAEYFRTRLVVATVVEPLLGCFKTKSFSQTET